jgi:hypothetical protein
MTSPLDNLFAPEHSERATDQAAACKAVLDLAGAIGTKHGVEYGIWTLMASLAIAARAVNLTPRQSSGAMTVVRKSVDHVVDQLGEENASVESIVIELHLR